MSTYECMNVHPSCLPPLHTHTHTHARMHTHTRTHAHTHTLTQSGANMIVSGSAVVKSPQREVVIKELRERGERGLKEFTP